MYKVFQFYLVNSRIVLTLRFEVTICLEVSRFTIVNLSEGVHTFGVKNVGPGNR